jgi:hypothetical protein
MEIKQFWPIIYVYIYVYMIKMATVSNTYHMALLSRRTSLLLLPFGVWQSDETPPVDFETL